MDLVKEESFWEIDEENKKFDFEVYPHMVEQLVCKIKEAQEKSRAQIQVLKEKLDMERQSKTEFQKKVRERISSYKEKEEELLVRFTSMESATKEESEKIAAELAASRLTIVELNKAIDHTSEENKAYVMRSMKVTLRRWMHAGLQCGWSSWMRFVLKSREFESNKRIADMKEEAELTKAQLLSTQRKLALNEDEKEDSILTIKRMKKRESEKVAALEKEMVRRREDHARAVRRMRSDLDDLHEELASERSKRQSAENREQEELLRKEILTLRDELFSAKTEIGQMKIREEGLKSLENDLKNAKDVNIKYSQPNFS